MRLGFVGDPLDRLTAVMVDPLLDVTPYDAQPASEPEVAAAAAPTNDP